MKRIIFGGLLIALVIILQAQQSVENKIRELEQMEVEAVLEKDIEVLKKIWKQDMMVNNPSNTIIQDRNLVLSRIDSGVINYSSFLREIEEMRNLGYMIITMGFETLTHAESNRTIKRRFTNVWTQHDGEWMLAIRHANIICE